MDRKGLLAAGGAAAVAAAAPAAARGESGQGVVGSWFASIEAVEPPVGEFNGLISFHEGGVVTEARRYYVPATPFGPLLETSGHGAWERTGNRSYEVFFRFLLQQAPPSAGAPIGTDNVRLWLELDKTDDSLSGTFQSQIKDNSGAVIFQVTGNISLERIAV